MSTGGWAGGRFELHTLLLVLSLQLALECCLLVLVTVDYTPCTFLQAAISCGVRDAYLDVHWHVRILTLALLSGSSLLLVVISGVDTYSFWLYDASHLFLLVSRCFVATM